MSGKEWIDSRAAETPEVPESGDGANGASGLSARHYRNYLDQIHVEIPEDAWESLPPDLSENHDRYIYGLPNC